MVPLQNLTFLATKYLKNEGPRPSSTEDTKEIAKLYDNIFKTPFCPSSSVKGFAHGPLSLHPWQIELEFRIHALSISIECSYYKLRPIKSPLTTDHGNITCTQSKTLGAAILHQPKHETVKNITFVKSDVIFVG